MAMRSQSRGFRQYCRLISPIFTAYGTLLFVVSLPLREIHAQEVLESAATLSPQANVSQWQSAQVPEPIAPLVDVTFGDSGFVAIGSMGKVLHSLDGAAWTPITVPSCGLTSICYGAGKYVALN